MSEISYFLDGETLPPPKFVPSPTGPILIFGSYNTRGHFVSERVFKDFGHLPPSSSYLSSIHLKNVLVDGRRFTKQLRKIDTSRLHSIILENVSLAPNSKFLSVELSSLKKYVLQCSHPFGEEGGMANQRRTGKKEVISAADLLSLLFFERAKCKRLYSWNVAQPQFDLDKDIKIMFNNLLLFETRLEEMLLYTYTSPSDEIISMYNKSSLQRVVLHRLDANSCILNRILPSCIKFLELTSLNWEEVEYYITNDFPSLEELVYSCHCTQNGPFAPTAVSMRICTLPPNLKRLSVSVVALWLSNPSATTALESLTIHNSRLEGTFELHLLDKLRPKRILFLGSVKYLKASFLATLMADERVTSLYVESDCVDWEENQQIESSSIAKLQKFVQSKTRTQFETFYTGIGPPYPVFLERERFSNPFAYLKAANPGQDRWLEREGYCGEGVWVSKTYQGFPSDDQIRWRDPVTITEGELALKYVNIETGTEIVLRLVDVWKSGLELRNMKRVNIVGFTMMEEQIKELFGQVGTSLETFAFHDIRVSRSEPHHADIPCEVGFSPRSYVPMDLGLIPPSVQNLSLINTWAEFKGPAEPRELKGLCILGNLDATFWTLNLCKYFKCKLLVLGSGGLRDKDKIWWDPVTPELLEEAGKMGANFIFVHGYKSKTKHAGFSLSGWEKDFLLVKEEYLNTYKVIRVDSKVTEKLLVHATNGKFQELEEHFVLLVKEHEASLKVRDHHSVEPSLTPAAAGTSAFVLDYRLETESLPDDNKWPKKIKPVEFFGFGIYSGVVKLNSIYMYNVKLNVEHLLKQLSRRDLYDTTGLEKIEILCTELEGKFPEVPSLDFPSLKKFVFKLRSNKVIDIISMGNWKYSTWKSVQPFFNFFTKKGRQLLPGNLLELGIDIEVSYFDEKILYYNSENGKLICGMENYNQILDTADSCVFTGKLATLGIRSDLDLIHRFPSTLQSLYLDVVGLRWEVLEGLLEELPCLETLYYFQLIPCEAATCTLTKLPPSLKSLELASPVTSVENLVVDFHQGFSACLDFISFSGCTLKRPQLRYDLNSFITAKKWRIDCDDFYSVAKGYKLISVLLREDGADGFIEEISWINRNYNDIPEEEGERWEQCQREEKSLTWEEFRRIEDLLKGGGGEEGEVENGGGGAVAASSSSRKQQSSSYGGPSASIYDIEGKEYKDWLQLTKHEEGKWEGKKVTRVPALEEVFYTSEISFEPVGKWKMKVIELKL